MENIETTIIKLKALIAIEMQNMKIAMVERNFSAYGNHNAKWTKYKFELKQLKTKGADMVE